MRSLLLVPLVLLLATCSPAGPQAVVPQPRPPLPGEMPSEDAFLAEVVRNRGTRDVFLPIVDPVLVGARDDHGIAAGEAVVAVDLGVAQVCYPTHLLNRHEIVEHTVEGLALLATW